MSPMGRDRAEHELLRDLLKAVEAMRIGLTVSTPDGRIVYVNPADAELHGWDRGQLLGQPVTVYAAAPSAERFDSGARSFWLRESENVTRQGERFPVRLHSDVVRDESGDVVAVVTLCENIRDERSVKAALQRRDRVLAVLQVATEGFLRSGLQPDHEADVLAALCRAAEVEGAHLTRLAHGPPAGPDSNRGEPAPAAAGSPEASDEPLQEALRRLGRRLQPGEPWMGKACELAPDIAGALASAGVGSLACVPASLGGEPWALLSLSTGDAERVWNPIEVEALAIAARILAAAEESDRSRAALHASEAGYRAVVESASDLIQSVDGEGRIGFVNEAWAAALGWSRREAVALTLWDVLEPDEHPRWREVLSRVMAGETHTGTVSTLCTRDGGRLRVEGNVTPHLESGRPTAALAILRNVSERERLARMKDEFVATVSHELRTPLTSMLGALSLLRGPTLDQHAERRHELTEVAVRNGGRLLRLVSELLDVQKLEAGQLRLQVVAADALELLQEAGSGVQALAEGKGVLLRLSGEPGLNVRCDRERLLQVLFNVLSNAIKFSPAGEQVEARARVSTESVEIQVVDRGPGIPAEFRRRLFEPFAQADSGSARIAGGTGLGLFISRRLMEAMGGGIRVEEREGGGTRAVVTIPLDGERVPVAES
jgi:PAS domain S-box-containing protein